MSKTVNTFNFFYKRAAALDRLGGLTDPEIINIVNQAPTYIKRTKRRLMKRLEHYKVTLSPDGVVNFSNCVNKQFRAKYEKDPAIKLLLLEKETDFGHQHHKDYTQDMTALEKKLKEISSKKDFEERDLKELSELLVYESPDLKPEIENRETNLINDPLKKAEADQLYKESLSRKAKIEKDDQTETMLETIKNIFSESIVDESSSNKLIETYTERIRRIEILWLKHRIAKLHENESEKAKVYNTLQQLKTVANDFRRLKFLLDQKALSDAKQLYFEEHAVFNREEMMIDKELHYELLFDYFNIPELERTMDDSQKYFDDKIVELISQDPLTYDIVKPFREYERGAFVETPLHEEDDKDEEDYDAEVEQTKLDEVRARFGNLFEENDDEYNSMSGPGKDDDSEEEEAS